MRTDKPLKWAFYVDGMAFEIDTPIKSGLGGSETSALQMCKMLVDRGHEVNLFGRNPKEGIFEGVRFHNIGRFAPWATVVQHDVAVIQRVPGPLQIPMQSKVNLFWMHDLAMRRFGGHMHQIMWNVDRMLVLSEFMKQQYVQVYGLPPNLHHVTRNGIDLCLIDQVPDQERDPKLLVHTARPERGMDILLEETFPRLLNIDPDLKIVLAGYTNYVDPLRPLYEKVERLINRFGGRVQHLGTLAKPDLYQLYKKARLYVYPSDFEEISCITAMECMACGLPMVGGIIGALPETLPRDCGTLVPWEEGQGARSKIYQDNFTEACFHLLRHDKEWENKSEAGKRHAKSLDWDGVAENWEKLAVDLIENKNAKAVV